MNYGKVLLRSSSNAWFYFSLAQDTTRETIVEIGVLGMKGKYLWNLYIITLSCAIVYLCDCLHHFLHSFQARKRKTTITTTLYVTRGTVQMTCFSLNRVLKQVVLHKTQPFELDLLLEMHLITSFETFDSLICLFSAHSEKLIRCEYTQLKLWRF